MCALCSHRADTGRHCFCFERNSVLAGRCVSLIYHPICYDAVTVPTCFLFSCAKEFFVIDVDVPRRRPEMHIALGMPTLASSVVGWTNSDKNLPFLTMQEPWCIAAQGIPQTAALELQQRSMIP